MSRFISNDEEITLKLSKAIPVGSFTIFDNQLVWITGSDYNNLSLQAKERLTHSMISVLLKDFSESVKATKEELAQKEVGDNPTQQP
jgi:hypothetical protein